MASLFQKIKSFWTVPPIPKLEDTWWGAGDPKNEDKTIHPFEVKFSDEVLKDLQDRLENAIPFQKPLENAKQHYGMNTDLLKNIVEYWKNEYDWGKQEEKLNMYPQFQVSIQGLKIHFLHVKPKETVGLKVLPLLLLHGWPGSVREFYEIIPLLTTKQNSRDFVFEVIVPSLPGFGFSDGSVRKGLASTQIAVIFKNLMEKLGFEKYYIQGGDLGSVIVAQMAILYPDRVLGLHTNLPFCQTSIGNIKILIATYFPRMLLSEFENVDDFNLNLYHKAWQEENGYSRIQATKPDTIGVALRDSPVGLAAYILEKISTATNRDWRDLEDGGLTKKFSYSDLIDNIMIYWVSRCMTTAVRLYKEEISKEHLALGMHKLPIKNVPCGCSRFYYDIICYPESILREKYQNLVHITFHRDGGHFAAFEVPQLLATDIYDFVEIVEKK